jgi:DNA-binding phage protein
MYASFMDTTLIQSVQDKYRVLDAILDERGRRVWAAAEARSLRRGGVSLVAKATGMSRTTIHTGLADLGTHRLAAAPTGRIRKAGGGRKPVIFHAPDIIKALDELVEPTTRGDPESPLRWTCKSTRRLAAELQRAGYRIADRKVADLLHKMQYSLQGNAKTIEGTQHPDRNAQFEYINAQAKAFQRRGQPVISVDTKKKELVGNYKNGGREWYPQGSPLETKVHDFEDQELGKVIPYGIYDVGDNSGWVSVGIDHDTADFAIDSILAWWKQMGRRTYAQAKELLILADAGGSNSSRSRLWKIGCQRLADRTGLRIQVSHFPPGTSKWNKIEHRMFSFITQNWRGRPLVSHETIINLIGSTTTATGLRIKARLNTRSYPTGVKVSPKELAKVNLKPAVFQGKWNYSVSPCRH